MSERLPWFKCYPSKLLGALSGMEPSDGYLYTTILLRIYETGGPIRDDVRSLARRTGLREKLVANGLQFLGRNGLILILDDGRIDSQTTYENLQERKKVLITARNAGNESAKKRAEINKENQQNEATAVDLPLNGRSTIKKKIEKKIEDTETSLRSVKSFASHPSDAPSDDLLDQFLSADPVAEKRSRPKKPRKHERSVHEVLETVLSPPIAAGVIEHRQKVKAPLTVLGAEGLVKEFAATGEPDRAAKTMIERGWRGFKAAWFERDNQGLSTIRRSSSTDERTGLLEEVRAAIRRRDSEGPSDGERTDDDWQHPQGASRFARSYEREEAGGVS